MKKNTEEYFANQFKTKTLPPAQRKNVSRKHKVYDGITIADLKKYAQEWNVFIEELKIEPGYSAGYYDSINLYLRISADVIDENYGKELARWEKNLKDYVEEKLKNENG